MGFSYVELSRPGAAGQGELRRKLGAAMCYRLAAAKMAAEDTMSTIADPRISARSQPPDPFYYGWRMRRHVAADGTETLEQIPLTLEDVLHPQEGDFIV